jgi:hypothetical protein
MNATQYVNLALGVVMLAAVGLALWRGGRNP